MRDNAYQQLAAQIGVFAPTLDGTTQALSEKIRMGAAYARMQLESHDSSSDDDSDCLLVYVKTSICKSAFTGSTVKTNRP
jgi:hypothetical protein